MMMLGVTGKRNAKRSSIPYLDSVCGLMWVGLPGSCCHRDISRSCLDPIDFTVLNCIVKGHAPLSPPSLQLRSCLRFTLLATLTYFDPKDFSPLPIDSVKGHASLSPLVQQKAKKKI
ncbi:hypothetical protein TNCV_818061 [Trichonephila clavipes]|nr:hypothetical protein TNCV_818061 [Trichonephila clavipes]